MLFYYLAPLKYDSIVRSRCMQFTFGDKGEVYLLDESALPVTKKEKWREGKITIGPRMKYGHANVPRYPENNISCKICKTIIIKRI